MNQSMILNIMNCTVRYNCRLKLKSRTLNFELSLYCLVIPTITQKLSSFLIRASQLSISKLADPFFYNPTSVDVFVGSEFFFHLLENKIIKKIATILRNSKLS